MNILKVGDTQKAACNHCQAFVEVTFKLRDVPLSEGSGKVKNILVGVCNRCNSVVVLPHQSTPTVKRQLEVQRQALESRVPAHMVDILKLVSAELGGGTQVVPLLKFYIHSLSNNDISPQDISKYLKSDLVQGKANKRISIKGRYVVEELQHLKEMTNIKSTTALIKSIILKIYDDVLVTRKNQTIKQLKNIITATV